MKKTLYFDVETEAKVQRIKKNTGASESKIVRHTINRVTFKDLLHELREDMRHADFIKDKNLLKWN